MDAADERDIFAAAIEKSIKCREIVDFQPLRLSDDATLDDATRLFLESGLWGIPVVNSNDQYIGTCTLRSLVARALPLARATALGDGLDWARAAGAEEPQRRRVLRRPVAQVLDLEVPAVRISTALPHLLLVLCRQAPVVPIVSDAGRRLVGVASLQRAVRAMYAQ